MSSSISSIAKPRRYSNSVHAENISEALKSMELVLFEELSDSYMALEEQSDCDMESLRNVAKIQCALDIVQSAKTDEEKATVYDILQQLKQPANG